MKETIAKINKTKNWFFGKINKIDQPLARLIKKKKKGRRLKSTELEMKKEKVITDTAEIQRIIEITTSNYIPIK